VRGRTSSSPHTSKRSGTRLARNDSALARWGERGGQAVASGSERAVAAEGAGREAGSRWVLYVG